MKSLLKSIFISIFPLVALYTFIATIFKLINYGYLYKNIGELITSSAIIFFFIWLFIRPVARTDANLRIYTGIIFIGFLLGIFSEGIRHQNLTTSLTVTGLFFGWVLYIKWYSIFDKRENITGIQVGNQLPNLVLKDSEKNEVLTSSFIMGRPTIFLFYRGNWCPLCMAQIKEIADQYKELEKRGVQVVLISPQPHEHTKSLAEKYDVNFKFLVDSNHKVAKQLEIFAKNGLPFGFQVLGYSSDTVLPTVLITDKKGIILYANLTDNYRVRPEPETFIQILDEKNA